MYVIVIFKRTSSYFSCLTIEIELILIYALLGYFSNGSIVLKRFLTPHSTWRGSGVRAGAQES